MSSEIFIYEPGKSLNFKFRGITTLVKGDKLSDKIAHLMGEFEEMPSELRVVDIMLSEYRKKHGFYPKKIEIVDSEDTRTFSISLVL